MIPLSKLLQQASVVPDKIEGDAGVFTMVMDSRKAVPGCCFVCMPSENTDSHQFLAAAKVGGAESAIVHSEDGFVQARDLGLTAALIKPNLDEEGSVEEETPERRARRTTGRFSEAMWRLAKVAFGDPSSKIKVIGVTGTNGKTTTAWLIRDFLNLLGIPCAYIGTLGFGLPTATPPLRSGKEVVGGWSEVLRPLANTTPFSIELNALLAEAVEHGCQAVAMEVSSHALAERRVDGIAFDVGVYTNLTQDHLDYHGTMEAYEAAKWRLFTALPVPVVDGEEPNWTGGWGKNVPGWQRPTYQPFLAALNMDADGAYERFRALKDPRGTWLYSRYDGSWDLEVRAKVVGVDHLELALWDKQTHDGTGTAEDEVEFRRVRLPLGGEYNVENVASAIAALAGLAIYVPDLVENAPQPIFERLRPVPGRFEPVPNDAGIGIIVDYAHTPDALEKLLATARPLTKGKVITVFGCGGDRDKSKRPLMGRVAQEGSDIVIVTSDNPRTEDPEQIIEEILTGMAQIGGPMPNLHPAIHTHVDRPEAISLAIQFAEPGDTVIIAGKGHENYQIIGRTKFDMDDRELARQGLRQRKPS